MDRTVFAPGRAEKGWRAKIDFGANNTRTQRIPKTADLIQIALTESHAPWRVRTPLTGSPHALVTIPLDKPTASHLISPSSCSS